MYIKFIFQLEELAEADGLTPATIQSTFNLDDLGENDEIFLMEIPKSVSKHYYSFLNV